MRLRFFLYSILVVYFECTVNRNDFDKIQKNKPESDASTNRNIIKIEKSGKTKKVEKKGSCIIFTGKKKIETITFYWKQCKPYIKERTKPQLKESGLHAYYNCKKCEKGLWKYLGKGKFDLSDLVYTGFVCDFCNSKILNTSMLGMKNCKYYIELCFYKDQDKLPYDENLQDYEEKGVAAEDKYIIFRTLGRLTFIEITVD